MAETKVKTPKLDRRDFVSDQAVRWCPGCGDYAILAQTQNSSIEEAKKICTDKFKK